MSIKNKPLLKKIVLGSVQFGEKYGISNVSGQTSIHQVYKILDYALINSINTIDTAPSYGGSEEIIGNILNDKWFSFIFLCSYPFHINIHGYTHQ